MTNNEAIKILESHQAWGKGDDSQPQPNMIEVHEAINVLLRIAKNSRLDGVMNDKLEKGIIYYLDNFTAPKVYTGLYFACLLTEQKIPANARVRKATGIGIVDWAGDIYKPSRFGLDR